jgi:hypothetical protein
MKRMRAAGAPARRGLLGLEVTARSATTMGELNAVLVQYGVAALNR